MWGSHGCGSGHCLRFVDDRSATIWVETTEAASVVVEAGEVTASARTFAAHGHHYALVEVTGLPVGTATPYRVLVDDVVVWPPDEPEFADFPPSVIPTLKPGKPLRLAFGSCRKSLSHDEQGNSQVGVDALRSYALHMAGLTGRTMNSRTAGRTSSCSSATRSTPTTPARR